MKRACLVLGPESSGTRLMTRLLIAAGCYGDGDHDQQLDASLNGDHSNIVWRRSLPHRGEWPLVANMIEDLAMHGYEVTAVIMSRDWHSMIISQQTAPHTKTAEEAVANIRTAYGVIFASLGNVPYEIVNYESITQRPNAFINGLLDRLGLGPRQEIEYIYDGNAKYYEEIAIVEGG